jgi:hypothetical protein
VAIAWSVSGLLLRTPLYFYVVGRRGPVRTSSLFARYLLQSPVWLVVVGSTTLACHLTREASPLVQLAIAAPAGFAAACGIVLAYPPARRTVVRVFTAVREQPLARAILRWSRRSGPDGESTGTQP